MSQHLLWKRAQPSGVSVKECLTIDVSVRWEGLLTKLIDSVDKLFADRVAEMVINDFIFSNSPNFHLKHECCSFHLGCGCLIYPI